MESKMNPVSRNITLLGFVALAVVPGSFIIFIGMVLYRKYVNKNKPKSKLRIVK